MALDPELIAAMRLGMAPAWWAERDPERSAVIATSGDRTFRELNAKANRLVRALRRRGLREGSAVALLCTNRAEFAETWAACNGAGFRLTNVNWHLTPDEAAYIVDDCDADAFIADASCPNAVPPAKRAAVRLAIGGQPRRFRRLHDVHRRRRRCRHR